MIGTRLRDALTTRVLSLVRWCIVRAVSDAGATVTADDVPDVERVEPWGLASRPPTGIRELLVRIGAAPDHMATVGCSKPAARPDNLDAGDTSLYSNHDAQLRLTADGVMAQGGHLESDGAINATTKFQCGGTDGKTGTLTIIANIAGAPVTLAALTFKGGILTNPVATAPTTWVGD